MEDIKYEGSFIKQYLKDVESKLKELLVVKNSSPVVLNQEPTFIQPTYLENDKYIYLGESRGGGPEGKGICYYKDAQKIIFGKFDSGEVEGNA